MKRMIAIAAACLLVGCTPTPPQGAPVVDRLCEAASRAGAGLDEIVPVLDRLGYIGPKAAAIIALIGTGRVYITAGCAIVTR